MLNKFKIRVSNVKALPFFLVVQKDDFSFKTLFLLVFLMFSGAVLVAQVSPGKITKEHCEALLSTHPDSAYRLANQGIRQSEDSIDFAIIKGQALRRMGQALEAKIYFQTLLDLTKSERQQAELWNNLGKVNANLTEFDQAVNNFLNALQLMEKLDDQQGQAFYLNNVGIVYDLQEDYQQALHYYQRSLALKQALEMKASLAASYTNIGVTLFNLGKVDSSLHYHRQALTEYQSQEKENSFARAHNNIGFALIHLNQLKEAELHLDEALKIRQSLGDQRGVAQTTNNLSVLYSKQNNMRSAWQAADASEKIAIQLELPGILKSALEQKTDILAHQNKFREAYQLTQKLDSLNQSIATTEKAKKVAELEARYQNVKKEKEIEEQRFLIEAQKVSLKAEVAKRNFFLVATIILGVAGLAIGFGYYQKSRAGRLFAAQNVLLKKEADQIKNNREKLTAELEHTRLKLEERNEILQKVYEEPSQELPPHLLQLSPREMEVLSYLAMGWSDKEIADKLFVSVSTTKTHLRRIYSKLLVKGRAEAVAIAHRHGIIGILQTE
jgi:DNA-binding CsgD family transcriptional regulator/tetratricopeptide (TPR) repeat protein